MIVWKLLRGIIKLILRGVVLIIQMVLTAVGVVYTYVTSLVVAIGGIFSGIIIVGCFVGLMFRAIDSTEFWRCFLGGIALGVIPRLIQLLGVEGIFAIKEKLYQLI